ncbi:MAG: hypothetical protein GY788_11805, partial [bacterium]|nr:hypothetical protein [bacterium]
MLPAFSLLGPSVPHCGSADWLSVGVGSAPIEWNPEAECGARVDPIGDLDAPAAPSGEPPAQAQSEAEAFGPASGEERVE